MAIVMADIDAVNEAIDLLIVAHARHVVDRWDFTNFACDVLRADDAVQGLFFPDEDFTASLHAESYLIKHGVMLEKGVRYGRYERTANEAQPRLAALHRMLLNMRNEMRGKKA